MEKKEAIEKEGANNFLTKSTVPAADNKWEAFISGDKQNGNALYSGSGGDKMTVVLRIYNPAPDLLEHLTLIDLPVITKI